MSAGVEIWWEFEVVGESMGCRGEEGSKPRSPLFAASKMERRRAFPPSWHRNGARTSEEGRVAPSLGGKTGKEGSPLLFGEKMRMEGVAPLCGIENVGARVEFVGAGVKTVGADEMGALVTKTGGMS